ncbi:hypothetical protein [Sediminimonas qiaohouensis]|uniref:hypothetical protein n=1 Tax=Sediminimonas qiaohouensis TaxID=552061 RepID=UPI002353B1CC|nr:hypothetical protein [Sediminimonas qiaohouensis]
MGNGLDEPGWRRSQPDSRDRCQLIPPSRRSAIRLTRAGDSVDDLEGAIYDYLLLHNAKPKPFVWSKTAEDIITRERRALDALDEIRGNR